MSINIGALSDTQKTMLQRMLERKEDMTVGMMKAVLDNARKGGSQRALYEALSKALGGNA